MSKIVQQVIQYVYNNTSPTLYGEVFELKIVLDKNKLIDIIHSQQEKGLEKYGHSIDDCPNDEYNWINMAYEEIADFLIYKEKFKIVNQNG